MILVSDVLVKPGEDAVVSSPSHVFFTHLVVVSVRLQAPGSRLQAPGSRLQAPGSRLQAPDSRLQTPDSRLQAPGSRLAALFLSNSSCALSCFNPFQVMPRNAFLLKVGLARSQQRTKPFDQDRPVGTQTPNLTRVDH